MTPPTTLKPERVHVFLEKGVLPSRLHHIFVKEPPPTSDLEEAFDVKELAETLEEVEGELVFMDAGAGDGRWLAYANRLAKHFDCTPHLVGIEGDPGAFCRHGQNSEGRGHFSQPIYAYRKSTGRLKPKNGVFLYWESGQMVWPSG